MAANQKEVTPAVSTPVQSRAVQSHQVSSEETCDMQFSPETVTCRSLLLGFERLTLGNSMKESPTTLPTYDHVYKTVKIVSKTIFGNIRIAIHRESQNVRAVKQFHKNLLKRKRTLGGMAVQENFDVEFKLMNWLRRHPHAGLIAASPENEQVEDPRHKYIVMPLASDGDLLALISNSNEKISEDTVRDIFLQLISALQHLHEKGKHIHGDVSPENILVSYDESGRLRVQLCDYGLACKIGSRHHQCGKQSYMAPEHHSSESRNAEPASDIFSLATVMFVLYYGKPPFITARQSDVYYEGLGKKCHYCASSYSTWLRAWGYSKKRSEWALLPTVLSMLKREPRKRPTLRRIKTIVEGWKPW